MNVLVLHSFSVMELWLRALGKGELACQGVEAWLHIPGSCSVSRQCSVWREHRGACQLREGAAVEVLAIKGLIRNGTRHGQSRAVIARLALSEGNSFTWAVKFLVLHWCNLIHYQD